MTSERIIGTYEGRAGGVLLIASGGIHGNEPAGVEALETVFALLEREAVLNPDFEFHGKLIGLRGNVAALRKKERYLDMDLNRIWLPARIAANRRRDPMRLTSEERELLDILEVVEAQIQTYRPEQVVWLDIHTTTASGGIFSITDDREENLLIARGLHAPVIMGMLDNLEGTLMHYLQELGVRAVTFEAGQHQDPLSVNRAIAALINCMRTVGLVPANIVENRHDELLLSYSKNLPQVARLSHIHRIRQGDDFHMMPHYENFMAVRRGELLAHDRNGPIYAPEDALILMPLYQQRGSEGFFLLSKQ